VLLNPDRRLIPISVFAAALLAPGCGKKEAAAPPPPEVYVTPVVTKDVPVYMELVGQARGSQDVEIRARVEGYLESVKFTEGTFVTKGTPLYQIDPKPFEATLAAAKADLANARARLQKSGNDVARYEPLVAQKAISQQELDNALSARDAAKAQVDAAAAAVDKATLDLGYTSIAAPLDGIVGTTKVKAGNLVGRGESTLLTTVSNVDPILFRAGLSEAEYLRLAKQLMETGQRTGGKEITLILADGTVHPRTGRVDAIEREVDPRRAPSRSRSRSRTRTASCAPASTGARDSSPRRRQERSSCRSAPCRSCRTSTAWPWWAPTARSPFVASRSVPAWRAFG